MAFRHLVYKVKRSESRIILFQLLEIMFFLAKHTQSFNMFTKNDEEFSIICYRLLKVSGSKKNYRNEI